MKLEVVWWDLNLGAATIDQFEDQLGNDGIGEWSSLPELYAKYWISDPVNNRWGAVMVWKDQRPDSLPSNAAAPLIGALDAVRHLFDVKALTTNPHGRNTGHRYVIVDAFSSTPLQGNPVAVFFDADDLRPEQMQSIAAEMNLSEVTFVLSPGDADADAAIRIFTPVNELPFAGHPLLGTAAAIAAQTGKQHLRLRTAAGIIPLEVTTRGAGQHVSMLQPLPTWSGYQDSQALLAALGLIASSTPVEVYRNGPRHVFVGVDSVQELSAIQPDHAALRSHLDVAVNCFAPADDHWRTRMFSPAYGVTEDAATGSAAGPLAIHLSRHDLIRANTQIEIHQGVELGRNAVMFATASTALDGSLESIQVSGEAVTVAEGRLFI